MLSHPLETWRVRAAITRHGIALWRKGLPVQPRPSDPDAVLNGIAKVPGSDTFLVTGKLWPNMYEVRLK